MRRTIYLFVALMAFALVGCQDFNLQPIEERLGKLETDFSQFISAQQGGDYITDVKELKDGTGAVVGYEITFKEHGTVVVRNGANGADGADGIDGEDGEDGDAFFKSVTVGDGVVTFVTADDQTFVIPMEEAFALVIDNKDFGSVEAGQVITVPFTLKGADASTKVSTFTSGGYKAVVNEGNIVVTAPNPVEDAQVLVIADNGAGKTSTVILNFMAKVIVAVADEQLCAKGDGETIVTTLNVDATVTATAPEWAPVTVEGKNVSIAFAANPDDKNARMGKVTLSVDVNGDVATKEILIAQAAAGCLAAFDSFTGSALDENWKGDIAGSEAGLSDGALHLHGDSGDRYNPLFWYGAKIRRQAGENNYNTIICTVDIKADGGEGGIQLFNTNGFDGGAYNFDMPNYRYFCSAGAGATGGGFYGFNKGGLAAADGWNCPTGLVVTEWIRLELSNIDRGKTEHSLNPDWGAVYIWSLEPDADGVLQPKDILWAKELWWWNDGDNQPRLDYGYAAVWGRSGNMVSLKNFMLSYTDK